VRDAERRKSVHHGVVPDSEDGSGKVAAMMNDRLPRQS
jgi:hypothetical protein